MSLNRLKTESKTITTIGQKMWVVTTLSNQLRHFCICQEKRVEWLMLFFVLKHYLIIQSKKLNSH